MQAEGSGQPLRPLSRTCPGALSRPWVPSDDARRTSHGQRGTKGLLYAGATRWTSVDLLCPWVPAVLVIWACPSAARPLAVLLAVPSLGAGAGTPGLGVWMCWLSAVVTVRANMRARGRC